MKKLYLFSLLLLPLFIQAQPWQLINTGFNYILTDISFPPGQSQIGFAVGENVTYNGIGIILKTTDAGLSWTQISAPGIHGLEAICFTSASIGYIGGWNNYFAKTTDGGISWTPITINPNIYYIKEIDFFDDTHGIVSGATGDAFVTADGGISWTASTGLATSFEDVDYVTSTLLFAVGGDEKIQKSTNGGLTWTTIYSGAMGSYFTGVDFYDANYGVVGGDDAKVLMTINGGLSWVPYTVGGYAIYHGVKVVDPTTAYVAGTPEMLYKTTNWGASWNPEYPSAGNFALYKIIILPDGTGLSCGSQGKILRKPASTLSASISYTPSTICAGDSVHFSSNSGGSVSYWNWVFPGGTPASSFLQNPVVVFNSAMANTIQLTVSDGLNYYTTQSSITVSDIPSAPLLTYPNQTICSKDTSVFTVLKPLNADSVVWTIVPTSSCTAALSQVGNYSTITLHWQPGYYGGAMICCYGISPCGTGPASDTIYYQIHPSPQPTITGPQLVCKNSQQLYQAPLIAGDIYNWTIVSATILSGQGTNQVSVQWGAAGLADVFLEEGNSFNCWDTTSIMITIDPCNSIQETPDNPIGFFPNPVNSSLTFDSPEIISNIAIYSPEGKCLYNSSCIPSTGKLDLSDLASGFYILNIKTLTHKDFSFKLIKE